jgi:hypothetical protein
VSGLEVMACNESKVVSNYSGRYIWASRIQNGRVVNFVLKSEE